MTKEFASTADTAEKKVTFARLGSGLYALRPKAIPTLELSSAMTASW